MLREESEEEYDSEDEIEVDQSEDVENRYLQSAGPDIASQFGRIWKRLKLGEYNPDSDVKNDEEKNRRKTFFLETITFIVSTLVTLAKEPRFSGERQEKPLTVSFWNYFRSANVEWLVERIVSAVPLATQMILGKCDFTYKDLLRLPRFTDGDLKDHGVYADIVTSLVRCEGLYTGSATGKEGLLQRWTDYEKATPSAISNSRHLRSGTRPGNQMNLRVLAGPGQERPRVFWLALESIMMCYLRTVQDIGVRNLCTIDSVYTAVQECTPEALREPLAPGLNVTWSLKQGIRSSKDIRAARQCHDCQIKGAKNWYVCEGHVGEDYLCDICYSHRRLRNKVHTPATRKFLKPYGLDDPSLDTPCPICHKSPVRSWHYHWVREEFHCQSCWICRYQGCNSTWETSMARASHHRSCPHRVCTERYKCTNDGCGKDFRTEQVLKQHLNRCPHDPKGKKMHKCTNDGCGKEYRDESGLIRHRKTCGKLHKPEFKCPNEGCSKVYTRQDSLKRHLKTCKKPAPKKNPES